MAQKLKALRFGDQVFDLSGKADLVGGKVPAEQLPSYVDDVIEVADFSLLPATGEAGKIYITIDNGKIFRWGGSVFAEIPVLPTKLEPFEYEVTGTNIAAGSKVNVHKDFMGNIYVFIYIKKESTSVSTAAVQVPLETGYAPTENFKPFSTRDGIQFYTVNSTFNNPQSPIDFYNNIIYIPAIPHFQGTYDEFYSSFIIPKK